MIVILKRAQPSASGLEGLLEKTRAYVHLRGVCGEAGVLYLTPAQRMTGRAQRCDRWPPRFGSFVRPQGHYHRETAYAYMHHLSLVAAVLFLLSGAKWTTHPKPSQIREQTYLPSGGGRPSSSSVLDPSFVPHFLGVSRN